MLVSLFCEVGCKALGVFLSPTRGERKIEAEYDLGEREDEKILVVVNQGDWLGAEVNLRYYLTRALNKELERKIKVSAEYLVEYEELSKIRSSRSDFSILSPVELGKALDAAMVLLVTIEGYELGEMAETSYYKGGLSGGAVLFDTVSGEKLWPESDESKSIKVGFDVEQSGEKVAIERLVAAFSYCTVRYFYDCFVEKFKIAEDRSSVSWENWGAE